MGVCLGWSLCKVFFKTVSSVVELADVAAYVMSDHETTTRMLLCKSFDIENKIVEEDKLFTISDPLIKFLSRYRLREFMRVESCPLAKLYPVEHLTNYDSKGEKDWRDYGKG